MGTVLTEGRHSGEFILAEADFRHCRDEVTVAAGQVLEAGSLLSVGGSPSEVVMFDGGEPIGILVDNVDTTDGPVNVSALVRGPCQVASGMLVFTSGTSDGDKETAFAALNALGVIVRISADTAVTAEEAGMRNAGATRSGGQAIRNEASSTLSERQAIRNEADTTRSDEYATRKNDAWS